MSYEGYEQCICSNGHYFNNADIYTRMYNDDERPACPLCKAPAAWINGVDETNGPPQGVVPYEVLKEKYLVTAEVVETCNLGHQHVMSPDIFRVPSWEETRSLRTYIEG